MQNEISQNELPQEKDLLKFSKALAKKEQKRNRSKLPWDFKIISGSYWVFAVLMILSGAGRLCKVGQEIPSEMDTSMAFLGFMWHCESYLSLGLWSIFCGLFLALHGYGIQKRLRAVLYLFLLGYIGGIFSSFFSKSAMPLIMTWYICSIVFEILFILWIIWRGKMFDQPMFPGWKKSVEAFGRRLVDLKTSGTFYLRILSKYF